MSHIVAAEYQLTYQQDIKSWYRRKSKDSGLADNWRVALKGLATPHDGPPKRLAGWQKIQSQCAAEIAELFEVEKGLPENAGKHPLGIRTGIARRMWAEASEEEKEKLQKEIDTEYDEAKAKHDGLVKAPKNDPAKQAKYVRRQYITQPYLPLSQRSSTTGRSRHPSTRVDQRSHGPEPSYTTRRCPAEVVHR